MFLLEPLSCLLRLATLQFMPDGTKVGIEKSSIYLVEPCTLQPVLRWYSGSSRDDLFFLLRPVVAAKMRFDQKDEELVRIMHHAARGLGKLRATYAREASTAGQCLRLYSQYLKGEAELDKEDMITNDFSHQIYTEYRKIWTKREITLARGMLDEASQGKESVAWVGAIHEILKSKEALAHDILVRLTCSITKKPKKKQVKAISTPAKPTTSTK